MKEAVVQMVAEKQDDWDDFLDPILFLFRTTVNPTTKFSPYSLMLNRKANSPNEVKTYFSIRKCFSWFWIIDVCIIW